jgi:phage tail protein X
MRTLFRNNAGSMNIRKKRPFSHHLRDLFRRFTGRMILYLMLFFFFCFMFFPRTVNNHDHSDRFLRDRAAAFWERLAEMRKPEQPPLWTESRQMNEIRRPIEFGQNEYEQKTHLNATERLDPDVAQQPPDTLIANDGLQAEANDEQEMNGDHFYGVSSPSPGLIDSSQEAESEARPDVLGTITIRRGDTISKMVQRIYGTVNSDYFALIAQANTGIQNLNNVPQGTTIHFPALAPRRFVPPSSQKFWLSTGPFDTLEPAYRQLAKTVNQSEAFVLVSGFSLETGLFFKIISLVTYPDSVAARMAANELSNKLDVPVRVSENWWKHVLFLTDVPVNKSNVLNLHSPDEHGVVSEAVSSGKKPSAQPAEIPVAPVKKGGTTIPKGFEEGGDIHTYTLLADGFRRVYTLRGRDGGGPGKSGGKDAGYIQVVAHVQRDLADREVDWFVERGWPAAVFAVEIDGSIYHRVLVGPFDSPEEAQAIQKYARRTVEALAFITRVMRDAQIESLAESGEAHCLMLQAANPQQAAELLEEYGWPVFRISGNMLSIGPLRSAASARAYQQRALEGNGWGPLHSSNGR